MSEKELHYSLRLKLFTDEKFFGPGVATLLENVDKTHSLLKASEEMKMAYTKALKIIKKAEKSLGYDLLIRQTGGPSGGGSKLTDNARKLIMLYRQFEREVYDLTDDCFERFRQNLKEL